jgi:predicted nucleic acid-binding protein
VSWLLDTNVISETTKRIPSPHVLGWVAAQPIETLYTASIAIAELRSGIDRLSDPVRKSDLARWLEQKVRPLFGARILEPDEAFWMAMLGLLDRAKASRRTIPITDLVFAATADRHGLIVVTRNVRHFEGSGLRILDPWDSNPVVRVCR